MRLIRLTTVYPAYLARFYASRPGFEQKTFAEQYKEMVHDAFGWADFWTHALSPLGYEVWEPIANAEPMQKAWARESGATREGGNWMYELSLAQASMFGPDVVFIDDYGAFDAGFVRRLRSAVPSIRLVLGWCAAPYGDEAVFSNYDVVLTSIPGAADYFRKKGFRSEVVQHAFEPRILERLDLQRPKRNGLTFLGSVRPGAPHLEKRQTLLLELQRRGDLEVFADVVLPAMPSRGRKRRLSRVRHLLGLKTAARASGDTDAAPESSTWANFVAGAHPARFGLEMFQTLRDSAATFNAHSGFFGEWASNMRLYEATGVGTCLLTDAKQNLGGLFRPDEEVVVYRSVAECLDKVRWLIDHPAERDAIARAGQLRTLRDHTFERRAEVLDEIIRRFLKGGGP